MLNIVDMWATYVLNAYISKPCREKIWTTLGKEFGDDCSLKAIIVQSFDGWKSSGAAFREHLAMCLHKMGYHLCPTDLDLWLKERQTGKAIVATPISSVM